MTQPQPGLTYVVTYASAPGEQRQMTGTFVGLEPDPVVPNPDTGIIDKVALHFVLTEHIVRDLSTQQEHVIDAPPDTDVHFHVWPEDLVSLARAPHNTENTAHEHSPT